MIVLPDPGAGIFPKKHKNPRYDGKPRPVQLNVATVGNCRNCGRGLRRCNATPGDTGFKVCTFNGLSHIEPAGHFCSGGFSGTVAEL